MTKTEERDRLRGLLFEDAPDWATYAAMDRGCNWYFYGQQLIHGEEMWFYDVADSGRCKIQPETFLDWKETLISRHEHED